MPQPFRITVKNETTGESTVVAGQIPDADWELLLAFVQEVERLRRTAFLSQETAVRFELSWDHEKGQEHKTTMPDDDSISSFLHCIRPFVLQRERFFLPKILNTLRKNIVSPQTSRIFELQLDRFFGRTAGFTMTAGSADLDLTADDTVLKWLNAVEYHRDLDKQRELNAAAEAIPSDAQRAIFLMAMMDKAMSVITIADMVEGLRDRGGKETYADGKAQPGPA
jgi:hypothetical protein